jgi:hypothetical protein
MVAEREAVLCDGAGGEGEGGREVPILPTHNFYPLTASGTEIYMECLEDELSAKLRIFFGMYFPTSN